MFVLNCSPELREKLGLTVPVVLVLPQEPHIVVSCGPRQRCSAWAIDDVLLREERLRRAPARGRPRP